MKTKVFVMIAVLVVCLTVAAAVHDQYTLEAVVVEVNGTVVTVEDNTGNLWDYEVDAELMPVVGMRVTLLMQSMNTDTIYDDQIVRVK